MTINKRIREIKNYYFGEKKGGHTKFIEKLGVKSNTASNYMKDGYSVGKSVIDNILNVFPDISAGWLLTGEGSMLKTTPDESVVSEPQAAYGNTGLLKEIQELKKRIKELEEIIKKKDDYINGQKDLLRISDVSINTLKESLSDKNMIIDLLNEKVDSLSSVKRKSTLK